MGDVVRLKTTTTAEDTPENVLELAKAWGMEHCVIVGYDEGGELCFGGSTSELEKIIMLLEYAKHHCFTQLKD